MPYRAACRLLRRHLEQQSRSDNECRFVQSYVVPSGTRVLSVEAFLPICHPYGIDRLSIVQKCFGMLIFEYARAVSLVVRTIRNPHSIPYTHRQPATGNWKPRSPARRWPTLLRRAPSKTCGTYPYHNSPYLLFSFSLCRLC